MIDASYDPNGDVFYVALERPGPAWSDEQPDGLLFRYSYANDAPIGVTVFAFSRWLDRRQVLAARIAGFLQTPTPEVLTVIQKQAAVPERQR